MNTTKNLASLRVPEITFIFWMVKMFSTTVGETMADFISLDLGLGMPTVSIMIGALMVFIFGLQFTKIKTYVPIVYWTLVALMSIEGTLITDILVDLMHVSLETLCIIFTIAMIGGFILWYMQEKTLSIHSINTTSKEAYYWIVILLAFALGTAVGDLLSESLTLGYANALLLFIALMMIIGILYYVFNINAILTFWLAYIMTRPLGAALGDYLSKSHDEGGLGFGMIPINSLFFIAIGGSIFYMHIQQNKHQNVAI